MKVNALIEKANGLWDERNAEAVKRGEVELPQMLPLIRLKVIRFKAYFLPWYNSVAEAVPCL